MTSRLFFTHLCSVLYYCMYCGLNTVGQPWCFCDLEWRENVKFLHCVYLGCINTAVLSCDIKSEVLWGFFKLCIHLSLAIFFLKPAMRRTASVIWQITNDWCEKSYSSRSSPYGVLYSLCQQYIRCAHSYTRSHKVETASASLRIKSFSLFF